MTIISFILCQRLLDREKDDRKTKHDQDVRQAEMMSDRATDAATAEKMRERSEIEHYDETSTYSKEVAFKIFEISNYRDSLSIFLCTASP